MVVKTLLYCTRKCGCEGGVMSLSCHLQSPCNGSTGQVPVLEHQTFSRTVLGTPFACTRCSHDCLGCRRQLADTTPPSQPHFLVQYNRGVTTMWLHLKHLNHVPAKQPVSCLFICAYTCMYLGAYNCMHTFLHYLLTSSASISELRCNGLACLHAPLLILRYV